MAMNREGYLERYDPADNIRKNLLNKGKNPEYTNEKDIKFSGVYIDPLYEKDKLIRRELVFDIHGSTTTILRENNKYLLTEPANSIHGMTVHTIGYCIWFLDTESIKILADFQENKKEAEDYFKSLGSKVENE